jgi:hypothetical protein
MAYSLHNQFLMLCSGGIYWLFRGFGKQSSLLFTDSLIGGIQSEIFKSLRPNVGADIDHDRATQHCPTIEDHQTFYTVHQNGRIGKPVSQAARSAHALTLDMYGYHFQYRSS